MNTTTMRVWSERKQLQWDSLTGQFAGYAAIFHTEDQNGDIIERGAFTKTLQRAHERKARTPGVPLYPLLWMHDVEQPVGAVLTASEDQTGLAITGQCDLDTQAGRQAFSRMQKGYASALSIGYDPVRATRDGHGVRHLHEIKLWETSLVTSGYAAHPQARVTAGSVKSLRGGQPMPWYRPAPRLPERSDYLSATDYRRACEEWVAEMVGLPPPEARGMRTRTTEDGITVEQIQPYPATPTERAEARAEAEAKLFQRRVVEGSLSVPEQLAYYRQHGHTPHGDVWPDHSAEIAEQHRLLVERLRAGER